MMSMLLTDEHNNLRKSQVIQYSRYIKCSTAEEVYNVTVTEQSLSKA